MKSKILALILAVAMVLSTGTGAVSAIEVSDISGHRSETVIREAMALGVIKGYPDGTYRPDGKIKREEFFSIINNVLTVRPDTTTTKLDFIDADPIEWYIPVVKTMVAAKITSGIGWGKVGIGLNITRQEAIKILATIIPTKELPLANPEVMASDRGLIAEWALPYYQIMFKKGYLNNTSGSIGPTVELTREEAAILLLKIKKGETIIAGNANDLVGSAPVTSGGCITTSNHLSANGAFTQGNGTEANPYLVANQEQLNHIREHADEGAHFLLTKDIVISKDFETKPESFLSTATDWSGGNFRPIGSKAEPFEGYFHGGGYTIEGLNIMGTVQAADIANARELASYTGLFGYISDESQIANLGIDKSSISGKEYTGAIVGYSEGILKYCGIGTETIVRGGSFTGGLAGYSGKVTEYSFSKGSITGTTATGALVGRNYGILRNAYLLDTSSNGVVGSSGMTSSIVEIKTLTSKEFADQKIEELLNHN